MGMALPMKTMKAAPMGAMKAMKAMKAAKKVMKKAMKPKRVSKIAKGKNMKAVVFRGQKEKTKTGLTKNHLIKNKSGKIVTKKASAAGKRNFKNIQAWTKAVQQARKALGLTGFCAVNGKTAQGKALYAKAKAIHQGA